LDRLRDEQLLAIDARTHGDRGAGNGGVERALNPGKNRAGTASIGGSDDDRLGIGRPQGPRDRDDRDEQETSDDPGAHRGLV
jgi:hypothetical protein